MGETPGQEAHLTRTELYHLVWTEPLQRLAPRYGLSDVGLAKLCRRNRVPVPGRGYWAKVEAGYHPRRVPLRPSRGPETIVIRRRQTEDREGRFKRAPDPEELPENRVTVPELLIDPHSLVVRAQRSLRNGRRNERGALESRATKCLAIHVTRNALDRALRIMDAVIKALEARGRDLRVEGTATTAILIDDERIEFRLEEVIRQVNHKPTPEEESKRRLTGWFWMPRYDWVPTGSLQLCITNLEAANVRRSWSDGKRQKVEQCLNSFLSGLVRAAEANKQERARRAERERQWEEERRQAAEQERLRQLEVRRVKELHAQAERWQRAQDLRAYVSAVVQAGQVTWFTEDAWSVDQWAAWANAYADRIDPLKDDGASDDDPYASPFKAPLW